MEPYPILLKVHRSAASGCLRICDRHMRLDAIVSHREQSEPFVVSQPAGAQRRGHFRERIAGIQHLSPYQMGADVAIAEREPGRLHPVRGQLLHHPPALVMATPTAYPISATAQRVHDRVEVRADAESVQGDVVSGVGDHGEPLPLDRRGVPRA